MTGIFMTNKQQTENSDDDQSDRLLEVVLAALDDIKGVDSKVIDVRGMTSITDRMVIVSGTSTRHLKALADNVVLEAKQHGFTALGVEGEIGSEWILVDLADVVVHAMMPAIREFYALEKLWSVGDHNNASA
jgi:ribosome-associated protein